MRKLGICTLVLMVAAGLVAMGACGGGGGSGDGLPQSSPAYAGSSMPAMVDSTTDWEYSEFSSDIENAFGDCQGGVRLVSVPGPWSDSLTVNGTISGTYIEASSGNLVSSSTTFMQEGQYKGTYSNYADSGDQYPGVLRGSGSWEYRSKYTDLWDGVPVVPQTVGTWLSTTDMEHYNYSAFAESTALVDKNYSGFMTRSRTSVGDSVDSWSATESANIAYNHLTWESYVGLLNYSASAAWDGSVSTYSGAGTLCAEGADYPFEGCVDFDFDLTWDWDIGEDWTSAWPDSGTRTVSPTGGTGSAVYEFTGSSTATYTVYAADGVSVIFSTQISD